MIHNLDSPDTFLQDRQAILITYSDEFCINEAKGLAEAAQYNVLKIITYRYLSKAKYGIGEGQAEKLRDIIEDYGAKIVIFDAKLRSTQIFNLAKITGCEVIDRERLILEIFSKRATTIEAKLQVELAELKYEKPRAKEKVRLAKKSEQPGFFGLGQYETDVYELHLNRRISKIKDNLKQISKRRELYRVQRQRSDLPVISLVGYTGAGKTTLFNNLTGDTKETSESHFTTLTTSTKKIEIDGFKMLLTDTVGFISRLPKYMVNAFKSTLEELTSANQILLLLDISQPIKNMSIHYESCVDILIELGVSPDKVFLVFNKSDMLNETDLKSNIDFPIVSPHNSFYISAKTGLGTDELLEKIKKNIFENSKAKILIYQHEIKVISSYIDWLKSVGKLEIEKQNDGGLMLTISAKSWIIDRFSKFVEDIRTKKDE